MFILQRPGWAFVCLLAVSLFIAALIGAEKNTSVSEAPASLSRELRYSSFVCKGRLEKTNSQTCLLRNVCLKRGEQAVLEFFAGGGRNQTLYRLPPAFINYEGGFTDEMKSENCTLHVDIRDSYVPKNRVFLSAPVASLIRLWTAENWAHFIFDNIYPIWTTWREFGFVEAAPQGIVMLAEDGCQSYYKSNLDQRERCERFVKDLWQGSGIRHPLRSVRAVFAALGNPSEICFENFLVGWTAYGMKAGTEGKGNNYREFRKAFLHNFGLPESKPLEPPRVVIFEKSGGNHPRVITNKDALLPAVSAGAPFAIVESIDLTKYTQKEQLEQMLNITLLITPEGGISLSAFFLSPCSGAVFLSHWSYVLNRSARIEGFWWKNMPWIDDYYYDIRLEDVCSVNITGGKTPLRLAPEKRVWWSADGDKYVNSSMSELAARWERAWRNSFSYAIDPTRMQQTVSAALRNILRALSSCKRAK